MTRALLSALQLDFQSAFAMHPMFWSIPICYLYILYDGKLINHRVADTIVLSLLGFGFGISWITRLF